MAFALFVLFPQAVEKARRATVAETIRTVTNDLRQLKPWANALIEPRQQMITNGKAMSGKSPGDGSRLAHQRARLAKLNLGTHNWIGQYRANGNDAGTSPDRHTLGRRPPVTRLISVLPKQDWLRVPTFLGPDGVLTPTANHNSTQGISDQGLREQ